MNLSVISRRIASLLFLIIIADYQPATAQTNCPPPGTSYAFVISGRVTDSAGMPVSGVELYRDSTSATTPLAKTDANGNWEATLTGCTLSPPRCGTGFNVRAYFIKPGLIFTPASVEVCPNSSANPIATSAPVTATSAASFQPSIASGSISALFAAPGTVFSTNTEAASSLPLPESLAGTTVSISMSILGTRTPRNCKLYFVSPSRINLYLPPDLSPGPYELTVQPASGTSVKSTLFLARVAPALFTADSTGRGTAAGVVLRVKPDGAQLYEPIVQFDVARNNFAPVPIDLGAPGDQVFLILFGTGFQFRSMNDTVRITIGGIDCQIPFAGEQGSLVGLGQLNILLSPNLRGKGEVDAVLSVGAQSANTVTLTFK